MYVSDGAAGVWDGWGVEAKLGMVCWNRNRLRVRDPEGVRPRFSRYPLGGLHFVLFDSYQDL